MITSEYLMDFQLCLAISHSFPGLCVSLYSLCGHISLASSCGCVFAEGSAASPPRVGIVVNLLMSPTLIPALEALV